MEDYSHQIEADEKANKCPNCGEYLPAFQSEWISTKTRMPEPGIKVLTCTTYGAGGKEIGMSFTTSRFPDIFDSFLGDRITHWMPLPEPPKP